MINIYKYYLKVPNVICIANSVEILLNVLLQIRLL